MSQSDFRTASKATATLALSCVGTLLVPLSAAHAQEAPKTFKGVTVEATAIADEPGRKQDSPKSVRPLLDTPQTVTVLGKEVLQQQNLISLRDALSTVPGISFGAGEGGSGFGDSITLRGYSANNDITIDGVRDSAQYSRSDTFDVEQIEVTNGANSVTSGSGSVGGTINLVSKRPTDRDQAIFSGGVGTADYYRGTFDVNRKLTDSIGFRLNGMIHSNDTPGRKVEYAHRWGIAPSVTFGMNSPTRITVEYFHQHDHNIPQYGVPYFVGAAYTGPLPGVNRSDYYGFRNIDTQRINSNIATVILDHDLSDKISVRNLSRYENIKQFTIADGPEGVFCLPTTNRTPAGAACTSGTAPSIITVPAGSFYPTGGSRGNTRATRNQLYYNQTDLKGVVNTGFIEHTFDFGISLSHEVYNAASGNSERTATGTTPAAATPFYPIYNPDAANTYTGPVNFLVSSRPHAHIDDFAAYFFDAAKLTQHFELNGGFRVERNKGKSQTDTTIIVSGPTFGQTTSALPLYNEATLFSYRVGLVYKPVENVSAYIAYGNSKTPSTSTVNGSCTNTPAAAVPTATCSTKPESAKNYEIGAKAELFDGGLLLTASLFRNDRSSYKVPSGDPTVPDQQLDGHSRVDGLTLGASGHITPAWSVTTNYTHLKSKLLQSVSDKCLAAPGSGNCTNSVASPNPGAGSELLSTPKDSGSIYTSYTLPFGLTLGYGATYQGSFALNTPATSGAAVFRSKSYLVYNATVIYDVTKAFQVQLNVKNIGDKLYYTRIRTTANGWATPGDARSAVLTLTYKM